MTATPSPEQIAARLQGVLDAATAAGVAGVVVHARLRGTEVKLSSGCAETATAECPRRDLEPDSTVFRMYSMTKVLTSAVALSLQEQGLLSIEEPISKYIESFGDANWRVVSDLQGESSANIQGPAHKSLLCRNMLTGAERTVSYTTRPPAGPMLVKHCMAECSGIGYDLFSDLDEVKDGAFGTGAGFRIANELRCEVSPTVYRSSCILGHDVDLPQFCDVLATAGVLVADPGEFSYGLGAVVLGRVIEVAYNSHHNTALRLSEIFTRVLFKPLGMRSAGFFLEDGDRRVGALAQLYGYDGTGAVTLAEASVPRSDPPYTNARDHCSGPRKMESGDTGCLMTVPDYSKFLQMLIDGGMSADGERVLSEACVSTLCGGTIEGLRFTTGLARRFGLGTTDTFNYGWAVTSKEPPAEGQALPAMYRPGTNYWSGYANTHARLWREEDSFVVIGTQMMDHHGTGECDKALREPLVGAFLDLMGPPRPS